MPPQGADEERRHPLIRNVDKLEGTAFKNCTVLRTAFTIDTFRRSSSVSLRSTASPRGKPWALPRQCSYVLLLRTKNTYHGEPVRFTGVVTEGNACGAIRSPLRLFGVLLNCKPDSKKQLTIKVSHGILPSAKRVWRYLPWKRKQSSPFGIWPTSRCSR